MDTIACMESVGKRYAARRQEVWALKDLSSTIAAGEFVAVVGASGSGKSTLLHLLGCLDTPTVGRYVLGGMDVRRLPDRRLSAIRSRMIGFVFQNFYLLPDLDAQENVELPLLYQGIEARERRRRAEECLVRVGLANRRHHRPGELSGGQQQRVAIARAMAGRPSLLLADEPTGNLDGRSGDEVIRALEEWRREGHTVVLITHDRSLADRADRRLCLCEGRLQPDADEKPKSPDRFVL